MEKKTHFESKYFEEIDSISNQKNYFIPIYNHISKYIEFSKSKILDVGCGTGIFSIPLIQSGCTELYGVDGPSEFLNRPIERGYKSIEVVNDLCYDKLPFENSTFDFVVCKDVFEHLINPIHTFDEIIRVVKPNGYILFHVPNHFPFFSRLKFLFTNNIDTFSFFPDSNRWEFPHIRFYENQDSIKLFEKKNLTLVENLSYYFPIFPILGRFSFLLNLLKYLTKKFPNQFAGGFTYLIQKK